MVTGPQVFISYQRSDGDFATRVREHLVAHGARTWMDQYDIPVGAYWPDEIDKGLTTSDVVIGVLSPDALASRNVKNEWDWAIANDKRLLLVRVLPCSVPHRYISLNFIDATAPESTAALAALLAALGVQVVTPDVFTPPQTRYARSGELNIAYQVFGAGPIDLVVTPGFVSNVDLNWDHPLIARFNQRLATFARVVTFDKRGTGLSDRVADLPSLAERIDDLRAVMDAAGVERAALMGVSDGGSMSIEFAATYPERTSALILYGAGAKDTWAAEYPWVPTDDEHAAYEAEILTTWGHDASADVTAMAPSMVEDAAFITWFTRYLRASASPGAAVALSRMNHSIDVRSALPHLAMPTLVAYRVGDVSARDEGRYLAAHIPGATLIELPGCDHLPWVGDQDALLDAVRAFLENILGSG
jgi:pimeloyl-ACP methyl ester carboxylesterase